jgi:hypothetical protein
MARVDRRFLRAPAIAVTLALLPAPALAAEPPVAEPTTPFEPTPGPPDTGPTEVPPESTAVVPVEPGRQAKITTTTTTTDHGRARRGRSRCEGQSHDERIDRSPYLDRERQHRRDAQSLGRRGSQRGDLQGRVR